MQDVLPILEYTKGKWENDVHHTTLAIMGIIILIVNSYTVMSYSNPPGTISFMSVPDFRWWERSVTSGRRVTANFPLSRAGVFQDILLSRIQRCIIRLTLPEQGKCDHILINIYMLSIVQELYRYEARGKYASFSNIAEKWVWGIFWVCFVLICFIFFSGIEWPFSHMSWLFHYSHQTNLRADLCSRIASYSWMKCFLWIHDSWSNGCIVTIHMYSAWVRAMNQQQCWSCEVLGLMISYEVESIIWCH